MTRTEKFRQHLFHAFIQGRYRGNLYTRHEWEYDGDEIIKTLTTKKSIPKSRCIGIVLNEFNEDLKKGRVKNSYIHLRRTTGYFTLDIDHAGERAKHFQKLLFTRLTELIIVWISASGDGVKAIGWRKELVNIKCPHIYWQTYKSICEELRLRSCPDIVFDHSAGRAHQLVFINQNAYPLIRKP